MRKSRLVGGGVATVMVVTSLFGSGGVAQAAGPRSAPAAAATVQDVAAPASAMNAVTAVAAPAKLTPALLRVAPGQAVADADVPFCLRSGLSKPPCLGVAPDEWEIPEGADEPVAARLATDWAVELTASGTSQITLTATVNQPLNGQWIEVFELNDADATIQSLGYCNTGPTCTFGPTVPRSNQSKYRATIGSISNTYPPSGVVAESVDIIPAPWVVNLDYTTTDQVHLTATSNYDPTGQGAYIEIFENAGARVAGCNAMSCSVDTVPSARQSEYIASVGFGASGTYPGPNSYILDVSDPVVPPSWRVTLRGSLSGGVAAETNYTTVNNGAWIEIFDLDTWAPWGNNVGYCADANPCDVPVTAGHRHIATVGSISNWPLPNPTYAISNQVMINGTGAAFEVAGGSNPSGTGRCGTCAGDPFNTFTGEFYLPELDISIAGRGPALSLSRTYSTERADFDGPFGPGWSSSYDMRVEQNTGAGTASVVQENGSAVTFTSNGSGGWNAPSRMQATLTKNGNGSWTFWRKARQRFDFDTAGRLTSARDLNGVTTTVNRNSDGRITTVVDSTGRQLTYTHNAAGRVAKVTDPAGRDYLYEYDGQGRLTKTTRPGGAVQRYGYDGWNLMTSMTDPRGGVTTNTFDVTKRLISQTDPNNGVLTASYALGGDTTLTSPAGRVSVHHYTAGGQLTSVTLGSGTPSAATSSFTYDPATLALTSTKDANGRINTFTVDSRGNRLTATDPNNKTATWTYDSLSDVTSFTDRDGVSSTMTYDTRGNLTSTTTPLTGTSQVQASARTYGDTAHPGDITAATDPLGRDTTFTYDAHGYLATALDAEGHTTIFATDVLGRQTSITTPRNKTTAYAYSAAGLLASVTDALNKSATFTYDANGNLKTATTPVGETSTITYDDLNRPVTTTDESGDQYGTTYDKDGNVLTQTRPGGKTDTYAYDGQGRPATSVDYASRSTQYTYDPAGNLTAVTDPANRTTTLTYDALNRRTGIDYADPNTHDVTFTYTPTSRRATMTDGSGTTNYTFDSLGRLTDLTNGHQQHIGYAYDLANQLTTLTYPNNQAVTRGYDLAGNLETITDWNNHTTTLTRDDDGNTTSIAYPNGVTAATAYDATSQPASDTITGPGSTALASWTYTRDDNGRLAGLTPTGIPQPAETYSYTNRAQLGTVNSTALTYDTSANPTTLASGTTQTFAADDTLATSTTAATATTYAFNALGERTAATPATGTPLGYIYDQTGRLTTATQGSPATTTSTYGYDGAGLRQTATTGGTTAHYAWDVTTANPVMLTDGSTSYIYDDQNRPLAQISATNSTSYYQHDQYGSTRLLTDATGAVTATFTYDAHGNLTNKTGTADTPLRWNGQYQDAATGLYYLRARYYDPSTAQFLTVDPNYAQTGSAYAYADNDPINSADPSGACPWCITAGVGALLGAGADLGMQVLINVANGCDPFHDISWGSVALSGLAGAAAGINPAGALLKIGSLADRGMVFAIRMREAQRLGTAAKGGDDAVQLFRHAGPGELADLKATGTFNLGKNSTGKYFADNAQDASKWGAWLNGGEGGVVSTTVPRPFAEQMMRWEKLDGVGPARFASPEQLDVLNRVMSGVGFH